MEGAVLNVGFHSKHASLSYIGKKIEKEIQIKRRLRFELQARKSELLISQRLKTTRLLTYDNFSFSLID